MVTETDGTSPVAVPRIMIEFDQSGTSVSLNEWIAWANQVFADLTGRVASLQTEVEQLRSLLPTPTPTDADPAAVDSTDADPAAEQVATTAIGRATVPRELSEQDIAHHDHKEKYLEFLDQRVSNLIRALDSAIPPWDPRYKAQLVSLVCRRLFGPDEPDPRWLLAALEVPQPPRRDIATRVDALCEEASQLRNTVGHGPHQPRWDFTVPVGSAHDPARHEPWTGSVDDGVIEFLVAPAYLDAGGRQFTRHRVFVSGPTTPSGPAQADSEATTATEAPAPDGPGEGADRESADHRGTPAINSAQPESAAMAPSAQVEGEAATHAARLEGADFTGEPATPSAHLEGAGFEGAHMTDSAQADVLTPANEAA